MAGKLRPGRRIPAHQRHGDAASAAASGEAGESSVRSAPLSRIVPSPLQPRKDFPEEMMRELMDSIREHGIIQPLIVREVNGRYELIAGERRWRACRELGLQEVPVLVREASDRDVLELALIENLQREDLNPLEEAQAFQRLATDFELRQEDIARRVGKSRASVANIMRLLDLDSGVQFDVAKGDLSLGHAKVLLGVKDTHLQRDIARDIIHLQLSVRATEKLVAQRLAPAPPAPAPKPYGDILQMAIKEVEQRLQSRFSSKVSIQHGDKEGKIEIKYFGQQDLNRIISLLGVEEQAELEA